jgi:hypothetical protein
MSSEAEHMRRELVTEHPELVTHDYVRLYSEMGRALKLVPERAIWMIADREIALYAVREGTLFVVSQAPEDLRVILTSRRLDPFQLEVMLDWEETRPNEDLTAILRVARWFFYHAGHEGEGWQQINGTISLDHSGHERCDRRELFARELARIAGWGEFPAG